jgi:hypothetical protein
MNMRKLTIIDENGVKKTWQSPFDRHITATQVRDNTCIGGTNIAGTEVSTVCFAPGKSSVPTTPDPGPTTADSGCKGS